MRLLRHGFKTAVVGLLAVSCGGADQSGLTGGETRGAGSTSASSAGGARSSGPGGASAVGGSASSGGAPGAAGAQTIGQPCTRNTDCTPYFCESNVNLRCVECLTNVNCPGGGTCRAGVCETPFACSGDPACAAAPGRPRCDPFTSDCVQCLTSSDCVAPQTCGGNRCIGGPSGAGGFPGTAGLPGFGGDPSSGGQPGVEAGGTTGEAGAPSSGADGAWARCRSDQDCIGDRTCSYSITQLTAPGRDGACVKPCIIALTACDENLPGGGGTVQCTLLGPGAGICSIACSTGNACPAGLDCMGGYCYWSQ